MLKFNSLKVENRVLPLGIQAEKPRFSWTYAPTVQRSVYQRAYRIRVSKYPESLDTGDDGIWDSGRRESSDTAHIPYEGPAWSSSTRYYWKVWVWDEQGECSGSEINWWESGLRYEDWKAVWIGISDREIMHWKPRNEEGRIPLPLFRRGFVVRDEVSRARAYLCGLGQFELRVNGRKVGDHVLEPGWTHYNKTCMYVVHDLTPLIQKGNNVLGVMLGNGFHNIEGGSARRYMKHFAQRSMLNHEIKQGDPKLIAQVLITYKNGESEWILSGPDWTANPGPIVFSCVYGGEDYDARLEQTGWDSAGFDDSSWQQASVVEGPGGKLVAESIPPVKLQEAYHAISWKKLKRGVYLADLGQNIAGWPAIGAEGMKGNRIQLLPGERLDEDGFVKQELQQKPNEVNLFSYSLKGEGLETWHPRFSYTGFRYVQVEGAVPMAVVPESDEAGLPRLTSLEGRVLHADAEKVGSFECSEEMWNRIHRLIDRAIVSNMQSVLTDCPHREKLGWLEEVHLMGPSIMYNYDIANLLEKMTNDMAEAQLDNGQVPSISPEYAVFFEGFRDSTEWGSAYVLVPWYLSRWSHDDRVLKFHYRGMKRYIDYLSSTADGDIIRNGLGDWADVGPNPPFPQNTPVPLSTTAIYYLDVCIMAMIAQQLGIEEDAAQYEQLSVRIRNAFKREFLDPASGLYGTGSQTSLAMPLAVGIIEEESERNRILSALIRDIASHGYHTTSGDVGHRYMLMALADCRRSDVIAHMLRQTDDPSYGYQIVHGATALTEHWDGPTMGKSQNHFMLGHIEEWFYRHLAGIIRDYDRRTDPAFDAVIRPDIVDGVDWVRASHQLLQGMVTVAWSRQHQDEWLLDIEVPPQATIRVDVPAQRIEEVSEGGLPLEDALGIQGLVKQNGRVTVVIGSGRYTFRSKHF